MPRLAVLLISLHFLSYAQARVCLAAVMAQIPLHGDLRDVDILTVMSLERATAVQQEKEPTL